MKTELVKGKKAFEPIGILVTLESEAELADLKMRLDLSPSSVLRDFGHTTINRNLKNFCMNIRVGDGDYPCNDLNDLIYELVRDLVEGAKNEKS